jgi:hypothetical protein
MQRHVAARSALKLKDGWTQPRRWKSYHKDQLTKQALQQRVRAGLGDDKYAKDIQVDDDAKVISTAAGDLPISPLFDTNWMKARRRQAKDRPQPMGRFRIKLANNPFGMTRRPRYAAVWVLT